MTEVGESLRFLYMSTQTMHTYNRLISSGGYLLRGSLVTSCSWCIRCSINNLCSMYTSKASLCTTYEQMSFRWVFLKTAYGKADMDSDNCIIKQFLKILLTPTSLSLYCGRSSATASANSAWYRLLFSMIASASSGS